MTDRERQFADIGWEHCEGIDMASVVTVPSTGREIRKNAAGKWEAQPHNDNYWKEFDDLLDAAKFASPPKAPKDDIFWSGRKQLDDPWMQSIYDEYKAVRDMLHAEGIGFMYGGTKGHGFWLAKSDQDEDEGVPTLQKPDDGETGNKNFWSMNECREYIRGVKLGRALLSPRI